MRAGAKWQVRCAQGGSKGVVGKTLRDDEVPQATMAETTRAPVSVQSSEGSSLLLPPGYGDSAVVVVPLVTGALVHSVLLFAWPQAVEPPNEARIDFVNKVGAIISLALGKA